MTCINPYLARSIISRINVVKQTLLMKCDWFLFAIDEEKWHSWVSTLNLSTTRPITEIKEVLGSTHHSPAGLWGARNPSPCSGHEISNHTTDKRNIIPKQERA